MLSANFKPKRTTAASRGSLATVRLSCLQLLCAMSRSSCSTFWTTNISQGSVCTVQWQSVWGVKGSLVTASLQISCRECHWWNFENRLIFSKVRYKSPRWRICDSRCINIGNLGADLIVEMYSDNYIQWLSVTFRRKLSIILAKVDKLVVVQRSTLSGKSRQKLEIAAQGVAQCKVSASA